MSNTDDDSDDDTKVADVDEECASGQISPCTSPWPLDSSSCRIADVKLRLEGLWILDMGYLATK